MAGAAYFSALDQSLLTLLLFGIAGPGPLLPLISGGSTFTDIIHTSCNALSSLVFLTVAVVLQPGRRESCVLKSHPVAFLARRKDNSGDGFSAALSHEANWKQSGKHSTSSHEANWKRSGSSPEVFSSNLAIWKQSGSSLEAVWKQCGSSSEAISKQS